MSRPGKIPSDAPSDAFILFDGKDLSQWVSMKDSTQTAQWTVTNNMFTVKKGNGQYPDKKKIHGLPVACRMAHT
ncbi:MAG: hypothetical protein WDN26_04345 [Chitinophagaceae bacterium]